MSVLLQTGQIWKPADGRNRRKIEDVRAAAMFDRYPMGVIIVDWSSATYDGCCTQRAFRAWIKQTEASLNDP
jgi:hypothetical protein